MSGPSNTEVLNSLFRHMPEDQRAVLCSVPGDPNTVEYWPGIAYRVGSRAPLVSTLNNYVAVSGFNPNEKGEYRRRKDQFAGLYVVMIDDIGTKLRLDSIPKTLVPNLVVETSPGNYQVTFRLTEPVFDLDEADGLIKALIKALSDDGVDPGMAGVTRVLRLPIGINGKPKYHRDGAVWTCRTHFWDGDVSVSAQELYRVFGAVVVRRSFAEPDTEVSTERKRGYSIVMAGLKALSRLRKHGRGWADMQCPWLSGHTDGTDNGAAIAAPAKANGYMGGFKCHHGHCMNRNWADLEEWVSDRLHEQARATRGPFRSDQE